MSLLSLHRFSTPLLQPFDLQLQAGECVTLNGPSGCGKSMLLRAIADLDPHQGEMVLDGCSSKSMEPTEWRRQVALLPAESAWWGERVRDHFESPGRATLDALQLPADSPDWGVSRLSSGERQRLALLRLLANHPKILLLDEPTANLDRENTRRVERLLGEWRQQHQCSTIWITHDPEQQQRVGNRHYQIKQGCLELFTWN
ncbi:ATP-binding protein [Candidatus Endoriftia persephone str. Guaymas]|jgi:ABC-type iron transport system FetAB ATPase subunit|uniref:ABC transporter related protein n=3 Tax=Gammaproteobacteria TaxID=1236 RepID=G2FJR8_9GAMM|nr:ATP-binding cassette domain-containing protein [Candidatus Endoriftia persephone]EGV51230.1 ABC transporter protein [endosymbiont of Riftia pachyptila (vent Ph05)]EGW52968.1 ABC transporter related protein [endosymbiont of Tevnia jerichonana (vent Tica)]MBA1330708.1 ATP-binding protein [Candidatus Endoriftia persephone str. Guaymas]USF87924.1 ATP-binding cassette domain-containing protein [Candidatus Endoriftia persephone]